MGNSGSQNSTIENILPGKQWGHSFPRSHNSQPKLQFHNKVLPQKRPHLKLRSTNNGEILHSGGTISGRHIKLTKEDDNKRSMRSFEETISHVKKEENDKDDFRKVQNKVINNVSSLEMKAFTSEPDLRYISTNSQFRENKFKKKYKAPLPPPKMTPSEVNDKKLSVRENNLNPRRPIRKARLFKTRAETKNKSSHVNENGEKHFRIVEGTKENRSKMPDLKRLSLPEVKLMDSSEFFRELKDATQRFRNEEKNKKCFNSNLDSDKLTREKLKTLDPNMVSHRDLKEKLIGKIENESRMSIARGEASGKESTTPEMSPSFKSKSQFKKELHYPKQLFYFGMNEKAKENADVRGDVFNNFCGNQDLQNFSAASDISSDIDSDENSVFKTGIDLQLRPILPKKQLEIPRFSPAAAWRLLSVDTYDNDSKTIPPPPSTTFGEECVLSGCGGTIISDDIPLLMEEHIEKYSRPFPPLVNAGQRSSNDKSGDSGISGDDAVPTVYCYDDDGDNDAITKTNGHKHLIPVIGCTKKMERSSWTPQQDLEDDSSIEEEQYNKSIKPRPRSHVGPHIFSLSLPRENRFSTFMTENINTFHYNGLNRFKKSLSGVWGNLSNKRDFFDSSILEERSDNWFLSKSAPNSLTHAINSLEKQKTYDNPYSSSNVNTSTRLMYLPEIDFYSATDTANKFVYQSKSCENITLEMKNKAPESLQDALTKVNVNNTSSWDTWKRKPKKYTFQSTIRQIEKKRLSDKLSKEAEKKERERFRELNAMQKVEEEFQRKRAREKANIRQQLRLFSLDDNVGCQSLPSKFEIDKVCKHFFPVQILHENDH